ncbi:MAG TPA: hypothetical protein VGD14_05035 [bacterium]
MRFSSLKRIYSQRSEAAKQILNTKTQSEYKVHEDKNNNYFNLALCPPEADLPLAGFFVVSWCSPRANPRQLAGDLCV